ncbi:hypothetical protein [Pseudomonas sp. SO81]|uniref:hypothetical protein n=1 Tax=Pseudomonas sp. SO81 TaxID=2983246 RepID=UPI0025A3511A|nr:hypothetical protein [Pseudomonas sp. SO81]
MIATAHFICGVARCSLLAVPARTVSSLCAARLAAEIARDALLTTSTEKDQ